MDQYRAFVGGHTAQNHVLFSIDQDLRLTDSANSLAVDLEEVYVAQRNCGMGGDLPEGMKLQLNYDRAEFIEASMWEVVKALVFAIVLVLVVIYLGVRLWVR